MKAKLARTASDTKNNDTVLAMRATFKQKQHLQDEKQPAVWRPAGTGPTPAARSSSSTTSTSGSASRGGSSSSVVDGVAPSKLTATTISASKRREENLRQFEALLAQNPHIVMEHLVPREQEVMQPVRKDVRTGRLWLLFLRTIPVEQSM